MNFASGYSAKWVQTTHTRLVRKGYHAIEELKEKSLEYETAFQLQFEIPVERPLCRTEIGSKRQTPIKEPEYITKFATYEMMKAVENCSVDKIEYLKTAYHDLLRIVAKGYVELDGKWEMVYFHALHDYYLSKIAFLLHFLGKVSIGELQEENHDYRENRKKCGDTLFLYQAPVIGFYHLLFMALIPPLIPIIIPGTIVYTCCIADYRVPNDYYWD